MIISWQSSVVPLWPSGNNGHMWIKNLAFCHIDIFIVAIPDADASDPETESDNKEETQEFSDHSNRSSDDYQRPIVQTANIATDSDTLTLTKFEKTKSGNTLVISGLDINSPLADSVWKDKLTKPPEQIGSPLGYFFKDQPLLIAIYTLLRRFRHTCLCDPTFPMSNTRLKASDKLGS
ncbi:hypothetical protein RF11_05631 [Thelohanellus kitauei]|uniref:Uncharacterized protein n=1 Tax=Thelohanellus kitauei TaxID=669202 RepID=A0A0C2NET3_THEKT|nr:hypothetical protein RF11_00005 [Thelohanellus kitauei]KII74885.1 hypothetical protein RF11_05631 [Thelohanellus kitauei]